MLISAILCVQCNTSMLYSVTEDKGWPTSAFLGQQPPVSRLEELHVTIETIPTQFVTEFGRTNSGKLWSAGTRI